MAEEALLAAPCCPPASPELPSCFVLLLTCTEAVASASPLAWLAPPWLVLMRPLPLLLPPEGGASGTMMLVGAMAFKRAITSYVCTCTCVYVCVCVCVWGKKIEMANNHVRTL
jgi:hypothetical protein